MGAFDFYVLIVLPRRFVCDLFSVFNEFCHGKCLVCFCAAFGMTNARLLVLNINL